MGDPSTSQRASNEDLQGIFCACADERWRYSVTPSLIGWVHTQYDL